MNSYFVLDNVLTEKDCNYLINYFNQSLSFIKKYSHNNIPVEIDTLNVLGVSNIINLPMFELLEKKFKHIFSYNKLDNLEIVRWPEKSYAKDHIDEGDKMGFFVYLNDDFRGGENELVNIHKVQPQKGRMSLFDNGKLLHKVNKVLRGKRYMLSGFYQ